MLFLVEAHIERNEGHRYKIKCANAQPWRIRIATGSVQKHPVGHPRISPYAWAVRKKALRMSIRSSHGYILESVIPDSVGGGESRAADVACRSLSVQKHPVGHPRISTFAGGGSLPRLCEAGRSPPISIRGNGGRGTLLCEYRCRKVMLIRG